MHRASTHRFTPHPMIGLGLLLGAMTLGTALAQQAPSSNAPDPRPAPRERAIPPPDELEPAVETTKSAATATPASAAPAAAASPTRTAGTAAAAKGAAAKGAAAAGDAAAGGAAASKTGARKGPDRLELDTTDITGNRELPKVLYIVPWKRSDLGDLAGRPVNSLLDEVLQPLDRDVFQRENRYYDAVKPGDTATRQGAAQGSGDQP